MHYPSFVHLLENKAGEEEVAEQSSAGEQLLEVSESLAPIHRRVGHRSWMRIYCFCSYWNVDHCVAFSRYANKTHTTYPLNCKDSSNYHLSKRKNELTMAHVHP